MLPWQLISLLLCFIPLLARLLGWEGWPAHQHRESDPACSSQVDDSKRMVCVDCEGSLQRQAIPAWNSLRMAKFWIFFRNMDMSWVVVVVVAHTFIPST